MTKNAYDAAERAARLFNVGLEGVTKAMAGSIVVVKIALRKIDQHEAMLIAKGKAAWMDCPRCRQSATNRHAGKHTCSRCKWREGQA